MQIISYYILVKIFNIVSEFVSGFKIWHTVLPENVIFLP